MTCRVELLTKVPIECAIIIASDFIDTQNGCVVRFARVQELAKKRAMMIERSRKSWRQRVWSVNRKNNIDSAISWKNETILVKVATSDMQTYAVRRGHGVPQSGPFCERASSQR